MPFNSKTTRANLEGGLPKPILDKIWEGVEHRSLIAQSFETIDMPAGTSRMPVMDSLPVAYFQNPADVGVGQPTNIAWANKEVTAETIICFVPVPNAVLEDAKFNVFDRMIPKVAEAVSIALDGAVINGTGAPASYPTNLAAAAVAASSNLTANSAASAGGFAEDLNRAAELIALSGYDASHILAGTALKNRIRRTRATDGQRIFDMTTESYEGLPFVYGSNKLFPSGSGNVLGVMIDRDQYILGLRRDLEIQVMDQAVITAPDGTVLYNAATQDGKVLRVTFRAGWQVANAATQDNLSNGTDEVVTLTQSGAGAATEMTISFGGYSTATLDPDSTAAEVQSALENLASIGQTNITVARSGSSGSYVYTLTFTNALGSQDVGAVTATIDAGTITPAVDTAGVAGSRTSVATLIAA